MVGREIVLLLLIPQLNARHSAVLTSKPAPLQVVAWALVSPRDFGFVLV